MNQADLDNHANQLNPDHEEYWHCREQPELPNNYQSDSEDDESFCSSQINYVAPKSPSRPKYHIIDHKTVRWGVEYDENTRCGYPSHGWPKDKPFVLPMDIDVWETGDAVEISFPEEWLEGPAIKIQKWWQHVKRYREKNIADKQMAEALQTLNKIRSNRARISKAEALLQSLRSETSQLENKFENEICKCNKGALRMPSINTKSWFENYHLHFSWPHPRFGDRNYVAFGERLIKKWCVRRLMWKYDNEPMFRCSWWD